MFLFDFSRVNFGLVPQGSCLNCRFPEKCEIGVMKLTAGGRLEHDAHMWSEKGSD